MVPVGGAPNADEGGGGGLRVAVSVVVAGTGGGGPPGAGWAGVEAAVVARPGRAWATVLVSGSPKRVPGNSTALAPVSWLVCTPGAALTSGVGTRRVAMVTVSTQNSPAASRSDASTP